MSRVCAICSKGTVHGRSVSHAHNVTNRTFKPNLQRVRALVDGRVRRILVCTRCLRSGKVMKPPVRKWAPPEGESAAT
jgi:large subunit ribosomal protein L28